MWDIPTQALHASPTLPNSEHPCTGTPEKSNFNPSCWDMGNANTSNLTNLQAGTVRDLGT